MILQADLDRALSAASEASDAWTVSGVLAVMLALALIALGWCARKLVAKYDAEEARAAALIADLLKHREE